MKKARKVERKFSKRSLPPEIKITIKAGQAKKGEKLVVLRLAEVCSFTDFFVIMHGNSPRQNVAICEKIEEDLRKENIKPLNIEGAVHAEWILMDYGDFIVHIFSKRAREYYALEKLWGDAPMLEFD